MYIASWALHRRSSCPRHQSGDTPEILPALAHIHLLSASHRNYAKVRIILRLGYLITNHLS
jgi:hypothetical protein